MAKRAVLSVVAALFVGLIYVSCGDSSSDDDDKEESPPTAPDKSGKDKKGKDGGPSNTSGDNGSETAEADGCRGGATTSIADDVPAWIKNNFKCVTAEMSSDGNSIVFTTKDLPNYKSHYYGEDDDWYEEMPEGRSANPNKIIAQNYVVTIPANPTVNTTTTATTYDLVGIAVNGVAIYNNQAAPGDVLANEIKTFDAGNGHPTETSSYHYHMDPPKITTTGKELVGIMRDGFPIYGKYDEDGSIPDDLDDAHGHSHATSHFPDGIYHYHVTDEDPYIIEVYRGTPGTMTNN